jgi:cell pole-organizing protein PopZ
MGDMSHEPSMEEILSSIKKIISEDGGKPLGAARRLAPVEPQASGTELDVLELTEAVQEAEAGPELSPEILAQEIPPPASLLQIKPTQTEQAASAAPMEKQVVNKQVVPKEEAIVSETSVAASRNAFAQIAAAKPKQPEPANDSLTALVSDMLRPMLKEWLDANLPRVVEKMVAKEIARLREE